jgi:hypothetical protein
MGIRAGEELLESLRDDRALFIDGERVKDVTADPRFAGAARSLAKLYDMQHDPALVERMTFRSPTSGERFGISFIEPRSVDDLIRRRDMVKIWMDASCGMFGRSPDFMNIFVTAFASAAEEFGRKDKRFAENLRAYHEHIRENDICMIRPLRQGHPHRPDLREARRPRGPIKARARLVNAIGHGWEAGRPLMRFYIRTAWLAHERKFKGVARYLH